MEEKNKLVFEYSPWEFITPIDNYFDDDFDYGYFEPKNKHGDSRSLDQEILSEEREATVIFNNLADFINDYCLLAGYSGGEFQMSRGDQFYDVPEGYKLCIYYNTIGHYYWFRYEACDEEPIDDMYKNMHIIIYSIANISPGETLSEKVKNARIIKHSSMNICGFSINNAKTFLAIMAEKAELEKQGIL